MYIWYYGNTGLAKSCSHISDNILSMVLTFKADYEGKNGYSIQGLVANMGGYSNSTSVLGTPCTERVYKPLKVSNM